MFPILQFTSYKLIYVMRTHSRSDKNAADTKDFSAQELEKSKYRRFYTVRMHIYKFSRYELQNGEYQTGVLH